MSEVTEVTVNDDTNTVITEGSQEASEAIERETQDVLYPDQKTEEGVTDDTHGKSLEEVKDDKSDEVKAETKEYKEFKYEEGILAKDTIELLGKYAKNKALSQEDAQEMITLSEALIKDYKDGQQKELDTKIDLWRKETEEDKILGGENLKANVKLAAKAIKRFDTSGVIGKFLDETGFGNNKDVLAFFVNIGKQMESDSLVNGGVEASPQKTIEQIMYPDNI